MWSICSSSAVRATWWWSRTSCARQPRCFRPNEPPEPSGSPKALTEPAAPPREPDTQGHGDDKAPSEPAAPPREPDTQSRGDDKAPSGPAAPPAEPDTQ